MEAEAKTMTKLGMTNANNHLNQFDSCQSICFNVYKVKEIGVYHYNHNYANQLEKNNQNQLFLTEKIVITMNKM